MQDIKVKDLMVALGEYATVSEDGTLYDAILALEEAQKRIEEKRERHRAILVVAKNGKVVGKISQWAVLWAIEPRYKHIGDIRETSRFGFSADFLRSMLESQGLWRKPLEEICKKASGVSVKEIMQSPAETELIGEDATLDEAIHAMVMGRYQSLMVTRGEEVVGVLRQSDVFNDICERIKICRLNPSE